jgi:hypothetical protein
MVACFAEDSQAYIPTMIPGDATHTTTVQRQNYCSAAAALFFNFDISLPILIRKLR